MAAHRAGVAVSSRLIVEAGRPARSRSLDAFAFLQQAGDRQPIFWLQLNVAFRVPLHGGKPYLTGLSGVLHLRLRPPKLHEGVAETDAQALVRGNISNSENVTATLVGILCQTLPCYNTNIRLDSQNQKCIPKYYRRRPASYTP